MTAILHRGLRIFFYASFTFYNFYLDFYFPFFVWTFVSLFCLDFYFPFLFGSFFFNTSFNSSFNSFLFLFHTNRGHILDFFQKNFFQNCSCDQEKRLKFEAEGWEFANILRSLKQFIRTVNSKNNFWNRMLFFYLFLEVSQI